MTLAVMPLDAAPARPEPAAPPRTPDAPAAAPDARPAAPDAPAAAPGAVRSLVGSLTRAQRLTAGTIVAAALILSGVGLYLSFEHVAEYAHDKLKFQSLAKARLFTVGVDVGILVLIAIDLLMAWLRRPIAWIRYPVWLLTGATIVLNGASAAPQTGAWTLTDYVATFAHAVVPLLFITVVEIGKTAIDRVVRPQDAEEGAGVPAARWFLAPASTLTLWRGMKLWKLPTYEAAVERQQALTVYRVMLERRYGRGWRRKAPADLRLPLTMAPYGLTIDEALALPREQQEREALLLEQEAAAQVAAQGRAAERAAQAEMDRLRTAGKVQAVRHEVTSSTQQAAVTAQAALIATERAAEAETEALESAAVAEARARQAAADRDAEQARAAALEAKERALGIERAASQAARDALVVERDAAEAKARKAAADATVKQAAADAAEADQRASQARLRTAEIERAAVEAEDAARLTPRERSVRRTARMILADAAGAWADLPLEVIAKATGVSESTASDYRREAADLIDSGYRA
ncbi:DUF2637 domain-containing protein [Streptomyces sp. NPDC091204]|uniref:DUF2637 domain-containing protein n=1 Tax=Streptomyces sp. NPDC091204 TaxID=3155299 RepID=UPI00343D03EF